MRFREFRLIRYGAFEGRTLEFPSDDEDFQVIVGRNEAGKSTTRKAVGDFLFGFPLRKSEDWRFSAEMLRLGGVLEREGERLDCVRKRGGQKGVNSIRDAADEHTLSDMTLSRWTGGLEREAYERVWSLDHQRLREGGEQMAAFRDDLGQQLLAAGLGLGNIRAVLASLEQESTSIWKKGSGRSELREALRGYRAARQAVDRDQVDARELSDLRARSAGIEAQLTALRDREADLSRQRSRVVRLGRLSVHLGRYRTLEAELHDMGVPLFSAEECDKVRALSETLPNVRRDLDMAEREYRRLVEERDALAVSDAMQADGTAIEALRDGAVRLEPVRAEWTGQETALHDGSVRLAALGYRGTLSEIAEALPTPEQMEEIRRLAGEHTHIEAQRVAIAREHDRAGMALNAAGAAESGGEECDLRALDFAIQQAKSAGDLDTALVAARQKRDRAAVEREAAWLHLAPWTGDAAQLRGVALPEAAFMSDRQAAWRALEGQRDACGREVRAREHELEAQSLQRDQLRRGHVVSGRDLEQARAARDGAWAALRARWNDATEAEKERFGQELRAADALADRRFEAAEQAARLTQVEHAIEATSLELRHAREALARAEAACAALSASWMALMKQAGAPEYSPDYILGWAGRRDAALVAMARYDDACAELENVQVRREAVLTLLRAQVTRSLDHDSLTHVLAWAEEERQTIDRAHRRDADRRRDAENARRDLEKAVHELNALQVRQQAWQVEWDRCACVKGTPLRWHEQCVTTLDQALTLVRDMRAREECLARERAAQNRHDEAVLAMAERHGLRGEVAETSLERLVMAWRAETDCRKERASLDVRMAQKKQEIETLCGTLAEAERALAPLCARAGGGGLADLQEAVSRSERTRARLKEKAELTAEIQTKGDGLSLERLLEDAATVDPDLVRAEEGRLDDALAETAAQREPLQLELGRLLEQRVALEQKDGAREAALEQQAARADIEMAAERYVATRVQAVILRHVAARQRAITRNPLLHEASSVFSRLTLGEYGGLDVVDDDKGQRLVGMRPDAQGVVRVNEMSEGTQDQLYLSLRLAAVKRAIEGGQVLPFLADDLFITFDEARARAGMEVLRELSRHTQVLFFTHHVHLAELGQEMTGRKAHDLNRTAA